MTSPRTECPSDSHSSSLFFACGQALPSAFVIVERV
jgi:hypothetical protein